MSDPRHSKQTTVDGIHTAIAYEYANAAARTGATGFITADIGKLARQLDNNSIWLLTAITPTWVPIGGTGPGTLTKSGVVVPGSFSGNPKKATVTFATAFSSTAYSVVALALTDGTKSFAIDVESKTTGGFQINLQSNNLANLIEVGWHAIPVGE
jgi:hypothetical protein